MAVPPSACAEGSCLAPGPQLWLIRSLIRAISLAGSGPRRVQVPAEVLATLGGGAEDTTARVLCVKRTLQEVGCSCGLVVVSGQGGTATAERPACVQALRPHVSSSCEVAADLVVQPSLQGAHRQAGPPASTPCPDDPQHKLSGSPPLEQNSAHGAATHRETTHAATMHGAEHHATYDVMHGAMDGATAHGATPHGTTHAAVQGAVDGATQSATNKATAHGAKHVAMVGAMQSATHGVTAHDEMKGASVCGKMNGVIDGAVHGATPRAAAHGDTDGAITYGATSYGTMDGAGHAVMHGATAQGVTDGATMHGAVYGAMDGATQSAAAHGTKHGAINCSTTSSASTIGAVCSAAPYLPNNSAADSNHTSTTTTTASSGSCLVHISTDVHSDSIPASTTSSAGSGLLHTGSPDAHSSTHSSILASTKGLNLSPGEIATEALCSIAVEWPESTDASIIPSIGRHLSLLFQPHIAALQPLLGVTAMAAADASLRRTAVSAVHGPEEKLLLSSLLHGVSASGISGVPYVIQLQWKAADEKQPNSRNGYVKLLLASPRGVLLAVVVRWLPLYSTTNGRMKSKRKAAASQQAASLRRGQRRKETVRLAVQYCCEVQQKYPQAAFVAAAMYTSDVEGLEVVAEESRKKEREKLLFQGLLGGPAQFNPIRPLNQAAELAGHTAASLQRSRPSSSSARGPNKGKKGGGRGAWRDRSPTTDGEWALWVGGLLERNRKLAWGLSTVALVGAVLAVCCYSVPRSVRGPRTAASKAWASWRWAHSKAGMR